MELDKKEKEDLRDALNTALNNKTFDEPDYENHDGTDTDQSANAGLVSFDVPVQSKPRIIPIYRRGVRPDDHDDEPINRKKMRPFSRNGARDIPAELLGGQQCDDEEELLADQRAAMRLD